MPFHIALADVVAWADHFMFLNFSFLKAKVKAFSATCRFPLAQTVSRAGSLTWVGTGPRYCGQLNVVILTPRTIASMMGLSRSPEKMLKLSKVLVLEVHSCTNISVKSGGSETVSSGSSKGAHCK